VRVGVGGRALGMSGGASARAQRAARPVGSVRPVRNGLLIALKAVDPHDGPARSVAPASAAAAAASAAVATATASAAVAIATASAALATPTASAAVAVPAATAPAVATSPAVAAIPAVGDPGRKDA
jgi:hypothetical protein